MRSGERSPRLVGLVVSSVLLAACTAIDLRAPQPPADAPKVAAAAVPAGKTEQPSAKPAMEPAPVSAATQRTFDAARQALAAGRVAEAERGFTALTRSNPELSGSFANLGLIHRDAGKTAEAVADLEQAVQLSPQRADLYNQLGLAQRMNGDFAKARASYEKAIALDPGYAAAVLNLGILHDLYLWDGERALELYERYMQLSPGGDEQVKRWIADLRNRGQKKSAAQGKEQG